MPFPNFLAGQRLTADDLEDMQWSRVENGADQTRTSTTVFLATNLVVPVVANAGYLYRLMVSYIASGSEDAKFDWTVPINGQVNRWPWGNSFAGNGTQSDFSRPFHSRNTAATSVPAGGTDSGVQPVGYHEQGTMFGGNGGSITLRFAQNTAGANTTTLQAISRVEWLRVS